MSDVGPAPFAIIAGFGLPGRAVAEALAAQHIPFAVIETNPDVVHRCAALGNNIHHGDVRDRGVLHRAGVEKATLVAICVPIDRVALEAVSIVRELSPKAHIIARCAMTSMGLEAKQRGADEIVVAEQVVAKEFARVIAARKPNH